MKARLVFKERQQLSGKSFVELRVWQVPTAVRGSEHLYKYSLVFVVDDVCVLRYDNEAGKGDHRHHGTNEEAYSFTSIDRLMADFWKDVDRWPMKTEQ